MIGTPAPLSQLASGALEYDERVASLIGDDDDMVEYLARLEQMNDETEATEDDLTTAAPIDPDELMDEVEQFLRDQD